MMMITYDICVSVASSVCRVVVCRLSVNVGLYVLWPNGMSYQKTYYTIK